MRIAITLCLGLAALFSDVQRGVLAAEDHADEHAEADHATEDHATEDHAGDHAEEEHAEEEHAEGEHAEGEHAEEEHAADHSSDYNVHHSGHGSGTCPDLLGASDPTELPGVNTSEGKYPDIFLSRTSWKPVAMLDVKSTKYGPAFGTTQLGYTTLIGDNGFPQYYQLKEVLLTKPKHTVDGIYYDFELQISSFKQKNVWLHDQNDMVVTSFFFQVDDAPTWRKRDDSPLLQQVIDSIAQGNQITEKAGVDLQRAMGPQLKGDFYVYKTSSANCTSATWYVFTKPIKMSLEQKNRLLESYQGLSGGAPSPWHVTKPAMSMKNTFDEGTLAKYDFYLDRDTGRNRVPKGEFLILVPIIGTILLASAVMSSLFVSDSPNGGPIDQAIKGMKPTTIGSPSASYP